jgi:hypothetical protein
MDAEDQACCMESITRKAIGLSVIALVTTGLVVGTAESASAATVTLAYPTQSSCQAGEAHYVALHWRITNGCTWYFDTRTNLDPWMFTAAK